MTDDDTMDILPLLNELRVIGQNGLIDADSPYDRERNERLLELMADTDLATVTPGRAARVC